MHLWSVRASYISYAEKTYTAPEASDLMSGNIGRAYVHGYFHLCEGPSQWLKLAIHLHLNYA